MKFAFSNRLFQSSFVFLWVSSDNQYASATSNLRGINPLTDARSHRILEQDTVGTFLIADIQYDDGSADNRALQDRPEQTFNIELSDGTIFELDNLPPGFAVRGFVSGRSSITLPAGTQLLANGKADMKGKAPQVLAEIFGDRRDLEATPVTTEEQDRARTELHRQLAIRDGTKTVLAVRVNASNASTTPSETFVSNSVFGNGVDSVNLASQYSACSHNKLNFVKATSKTGSYANISNGVVTVNLPSVSTSDGDGVMRNAITNELFNIFGTSASNLADHVMYCLPPNTMSGIAYAYINSWNSVYSDYWCTYVSAQMHEIGHNLNFAHSNEAGTYKDQTGMMGYSYSSSDTSMCFNGAKSWQTGWYTDKEVTVNSAGGSPNTCFQGDLYGIVDYPIATTVLLQVRDDVNSYDYYVNFNAQKGFNSGTREASNQVTVTRRSQSTVRDSYAESELVAKLSAGGSFFFGNYNINVGAIDTSLGKAQVTVLPTGQTVCPSSSPAPTNAPTSVPTNAPTLAPTNAPTTAPTNVPTTGPTNAPTLAPTPAPIPPTNPPTSAPTKAPTLAPTPAPVPPTNPPTSAPTNAPTLAPTNAPTNAPTPSPTPNPTSCDCSLFGGGGECKKGCGGTCIWDKGTCLTAGGPPAPTNAPTPAPTPNPTVAGPPTTPTPTNAPSSSPTRKPTLCDCTQFGGGGACKSGCGGTCNWVKGACLP